MKRFTVEPLPDRPNLEFQQKLARQLLRDVWAGDAEAIARVRTFLPGALNPDALKLHDTQLAIARGYGFDSWAAMKRKIESLTKSPLELFDAAVREGDAERARELLAKHSDLRARINEPRFDFDSPAILQARKNLPLVDALLEYGADINARSTWWAGGFTILEGDLTLEQAMPLIRRGARVTLWSAAGLGLYDELKSLIQARPDSINERGGDGKTALHCASSCAIAELLLDSGADPSLRDVDHGATPLQYRIADEAISRLLVARGGKADIFAAARLGDRELIEQCLRDDLLAAETRVNHPPFTAPGGHIYGWTLGFDLTPADVARKFGHEEVAQLIVSKLSPKARLIDALWCGNEARARRELALHPDALQDLQPCDHGLMAAAAWWYRPESVRLMLEFGFDPHASGVHRSTPLDRASFHGYADIVEMLLSRDPAPPIEYENEFGGRPLEACVHGSLHGWKTGHPQDHVRTLTLLLRAGTRLNPAILPTGNDELDAVMRAWLKKGSEQSG
jgi:ankyrin repeat protein